MILRGAGAACVLALGLCGCASLPFGEAKPDSPARPPGAATPTGEANTATDRAGYQLEVAAPKELRPLLTNYLDLSRFQNAPETEGITTAELDRLIAAAPAQARTLLETEG